MTDVQQRDPAQVFINALREVGIDVNGVIYDPTKTNPADQLHWNYDRRHNSEKVERLVHRAACLAISDEAVCYDCFSENGGNSHGNGHCHGSQCIACDGCEDAGR